MGYALPVATAGRACRPDGEKALAPGNLTGAAAVGASFWAGAGFTATAITSGAQFRFFDRDLRVGSKSGRHEIERQVISQVCTAPCPWTRLPPAEAEKIFEYAAETGKNVFEAAETGKSRPSSPSWPY
jgi:hypothetical protein